MGNGNVFFMISKNVLLADVMGSFLMTTRCCFDCWRKRSGTKSEWEVLLCLQNEAAETKF
jgi:hypothetical protein